MSIKKYNEAKSIIQKNDYLVDDFEGAARDTIKKAQSILGVKFPEDYKLYLTEFGALTFGSIEIYGVFREGFENSGIPDTVWATLNERELVNMPNHLTVLYNSGMGELYCMNFKILNNENEPKITSYYPGFSEKAQNNEVLFDSFGSFLLDMVTEEVK